VVTKAGGLTVHDLRQVIGFHEFMVD